MALLHTHRALLPDGWASNVQIAIDENGLITAVDQNVSTTSDQMSLDCLLPGIANVHSHAFQRAMAGRAECRSDREDSFWTWRKLLYQFVARINPDNLRQIATQLYIEMLKAGYTAVAEFHYIHNQPDGRPYSDPAAMCQALIDAADATGIRLTLLPTLYMQAGFGGSLPMEASQQRFASTVDHYLQRLATLTSASATRYKTGIAFHSLRAVSPEAINEVMAWRDQQSEILPVHIHAAEQLPEVAACVKWSGMRPVEWLLNRGIDSDWCIIHATHLTAGEITALAASGAVAGLCPTTEAHLGDGIFPLADYLAAGGKIAIGSDSHVSVSPIEELRWLEYTQRLNHRQRNLAATVDQPHTGERLLLSTLAGGAHALGLSNPKQPTAGQIAPGCVADLIEIDTSHPTLVECTDEQLLNCLIFSGNHNPVRHVMTQGRWVIRDRRHEQETGAAADYQKVLRILIK